MGKNARCVGAGHSNPATVIIELTSNEDHRDGGDHNGEELNGLTGDAYPDFLCVGGNHRNGHEATVTTLTATTVTETASTTSPGMHVPTSYALERRRPEPRGFTGNSSRIQISGCLR